MFQRLPVALTQVKAGNTSEVFAKWNSSIDDILKIILDIWYRGRSILEFKFIILRSTLELIF